MNGSALTFGRFPLCALGTGKVRIASGVLGPEPERAEASANASSAKKVIALAAIPVLPISEPLPAKRFFITISPCNMAWQLALTGLHAEEAEPLLVSERREIDAIFEFRNCQVSEGRAGLGRQTSGNSASSVARKVPGLRPWSRRRVEIETASLSLWIRLGLPAVSSNICSMRPPDEASSLRRTMPRYAVHVTGEVRPIDRSRLDSFGMPLQSLTSAPIANGVSSGGGITR